MAELDTASAADLREQQRALGRVLRAVARGEGLQPVLDELIAEASRLCDGEYGELHLVEDDVLRAFSYYVAGDLDSPIVRSAAEQWEIGRAQPHARDRSTLAGRVALLEDVVLMPDMLADPEYTYSLPAGTRAGLGVPIVLDGDLIGTMGIVRDVRFPFTDDDVELVRTFADQAAIAIRNARLVEALRRQLDQQRGIGEILRSIARSTGLQTVLDEIVETVAILCQGDNVRMWLVRDGLLHAVANGGWTDGWDYDKAHPHAIDASSASGRAALTKEPVHIPDVTADPEYAYDGPVAFRTNLSVPILLDDEVIGVFGIVHREAQPFREEVIDLVRTFADQAAVAIANARLIDAVQRQLEQQKAIGEVLAVVARSDGLEAVFDIVADSATRLCRGDYGALYLREGDVLVVAAQRYGRPDTLKFEQEHPHAIDRTTAIGRAAVTRDVVHIPDTHEDPEYSWGAAGIMEYRSLLAAPILLEGELIGAMNVVKVAPEPFAPEETELIRTFADQAAIAIANARLIDAVERQLDQQSAIAEVLQVVVRSEGLPAVFSAVVEAARRLSGGLSAQLYLLDGDVLRVAAQAEEEVPAYEHAEQHPHALDRTTLAGRVALERDVVQIPDVSSDPDYNYALPEHIRSLLGVPIVRDDELVGALAIGGDAVGAFPDDVVRLVKTFADQAAIAVANARLLEARNRKLEQQREISEILGAVARGEGLEAVFDMVVETAARLCSAEYGQICLADGEVLRLAGTYGAPAEVVAYERAHPMPRDRSSVVGRVAVTGEVVHIPDVLADPEYSWWESRDLGGWRAMLGVPVFVDEVLTGVINVVRNDPLPFGDEQIELVKTFADQAAIAIGNARLIAAVEQQLEQQKAISDVLGAVAQAEGIDSVLHAVVEIACRLCQADFGEVHLIEGELLRLAVGHGGPPELYEYTREHPDPAVGSRATVNGRILLSGDIEHVPDILDDPEYSFPAADEAGVRALLGAPLLVEGELVGVFNVVRTEPVPFTDDQIELLRTFADQAAIAVAKARLMDALEHQLEQQRAISGVFGVVARAEGLDSVFTVAVEAATRLCGGEYGGLYILEGGLFHARSHFGMTEQFDYEKEHPHAPDRKTLVGRAALTRDVVHIPSLEDDPEYDWPLLLGHHAGLAVPIMAEDELMGVIAVTRKPDAFTPDQVELVKTFADQAAIAIANARLMEAVDRQRSELSRFVSPQVAELVTSDEGEKMLTGHRAYVTSMFCDLRGFTSFTELAEPEELFEVLREYHVALGELIPSYEGTLEHFAGDGLMVFFNDPVPVEEHELKAVQLALSAQERFEELAAEWRKRGHELALGIGIAAGYATLGRIGFEGRYDYGVLGTVTNLASRLSSAAELGQTLISQRVYAAVEDKVDAHEIGQLELKGFGRPIPAFEVRGLKE